MCGSIVISGIMITGNRHNNINRINLLVTINNDKGHVEVVSLCVGKLTSV